jgi:hypothetical protein
MAMCGQRVSTDDQEADVMIDERSQETLETSGFGSMFPPVVLATEFFDGSDSLLGGPREPVAPRFAGVGWRRHHTMLKFGPRRPGNGGEADQPGMPRAAAVLWMCSRISSRKELHADRS